ncbi:MAG: hypothetical protein AAGE86_01630 [Pseudomonadota bacterium]
MLFSRSANSEFKMRRRNRLPIAAHPFFVPALTVWGAALAGLIVMVLPASIINQITTATALGVLDGFARYFFAGLAAALGGAFGYYVATKWRGRLPGRSEALIDRAADHHVRPIDPASELGSESLDAPIEEQSAEEEPVADESFPTGEPASPETDDTLELGAEFETAPEPTEEVTHVDPLAGEHLKPANETPEADSPEPASRLPLRRRRNRGKQLELVQALSDHRARQSALNKDHLDLSEFTQLAEKNKASRPARKPTAVETLRAVPPQDLSLVQMVERLAVALHERQEAARKRPPTEQATEREAALAEALKALSVFTEKGLAADDKAATSAKPQVSEPEDGTERELREALGKLQTMRGAA